MERRRISRRTFIAVVPIAGIALVAPALASGGEDEPATREQSRANLPFKAYVGAAAKDGLNPAAQGDFTTATQAVFNGGEIVVTTLVRSAVNAVVVVDMEIYQPSGARVDQQWFDNQQFFPGQEQTFTTRWTPPPGAPRGSYLVKVGIFEPGREWQILYHWNDAAVRVTLP